jgi:glycosyltransferase involved in cell wall biosynthesis
LTPEFSQRVTIVERRLTHYRVPLYERMRELLVDKEIEFKLLVGSGTPEEMAKHDTGHLPWATTLPTHYFFSGTICWQSLGGRLRDVDLLIVNHQNGLLYNQRLFWMPRRFRLGLWGHGRNMRARSPHGFRERLKRWSISRADWYFAYTQITVDAVAQTGFPLSRITNLNNTIDTSALCRDRDSVSPEEVAALKSDLGIGGMPVGVFIGSLYPEKRLDFLFEAACRLRQRLPGFQWMIIGDGPEHAKAQEWAAAHDWVHWVGARHGRDKALYLSCADVMLSPGALGLGIIDSFVCGIPIVAADNGIHGPEIAYLRPGENGLLTRDDIEDFALAVSSLLADPDTLRRIRRACLTSAADYSLTNMASRFVDGMVQALAAPRYR